MTARGPRGSSLAVSVLVTVLAVAGAVVLVVRLPGHASELASASSTASAARGPGPASPPAGMARDGRPAPSPSPAASTPAPARPSSPVPSATARPGPASTAPASTGPASSGPASSGPAAGLSAAARQVLALINQARAQAGLPAYTISSGLDTSASRHTALMAGGCGLSHQCPGEPALGDRETAAGVHWTAAGENIGEGGPVADTAAAIAQLAVGLTQSMLDEKPPDDGHRRSILSSEFTQAGISVFRDSSGTVWLTQDFAN